MPSFMIPPTHLFTPPKRIFHSQRYKDLKDLNIIRGFESGVKGLTKCVFISRLGLLLLKIGYRALEDSNDA
jgi:hypothetical protein